MDRSIERTGEGGEGESNYLILSIMQASSPLRGVRCASTNVNAVTNLPPEGMTCVYLSFLSFPRFSHYRPR